MSSLVSGTHAPERLARVRPGAPRWSSARPRCSSALCCPARPRWCWAGCWPAAAIRSPVLIVVVVLTAVTGPLVGYESASGWATGCSPAAAAPGPRPAGQGQDGAARAGRHRGAGGPVRGHPAGADACRGGRGRVPYRTFAIHNTISGMVWRVGYSLLGYLAGSAYVVSSARRRRPRHRHRRLGPGRRCRLGRRRHRRERGRGPEVPRAERRISQTPVSARSTKRQDHQYD